MRDSQRGRRRLLTIAVRAAASQPIVVWGGLVVEGLYQLYHYIPCVRGGDEGTVRLTRAPRRHPTQSVSQDPSEVQMGGARRCL